VTEGTQGRLAAGGAVLAAVLSSACCWLPLLLLLVGSGASVASVSAFFEAWRWPLVGGAVVLLGIGFFLAYRPCGVGPVKPASCPAPDSVG